MDAIFIFGARYLFVFVPIIALIFFLKQSRLKQKEIVIFSIVSVIPIYSVAIIASHVYFDPRPFIVDNVKPLIPSSTDNGFPSDHTLLVSVVASVIMYFNRRIGIALWIIAICVGISRVYVGVHHTIDVLGSMLISIFFTSIVYVLLKRK